MLPIFEMNGKKLTHSPGPIEASEETLFISKEKFSCTPWAKTTLDRMQEIVISINVLIVVLILEIPSSY